MKARGLPIGRTGALILLLVVALGGLFWSANLVTPAPAVFAAGEVCRRFDLTRPDGRVLVGQAEDLAFDRAAGRLVLSLYDRKSNRPGGLYGVDAASLSAAIDASGSAPLMLTPLIDDARFTRPHGITLSSDRLAVIARDGAGDAEVRLLRRAGARWRPGGALSHPRACRANDLAWLDVDNLLVSIDRAACGGFSAFAEQVRGATAGALLRWNVADGAVTEVADALAFANGLALAEGRVALAETRGDRLRLYDGQVLARTPLPLQDYETVALPGGPDNLSVTEDGRVLVALHDNLVRLAMARYGPLARAPGRIAILDGTWLRVLLDDPAGAVIPGATVAAEITPGLLAVGSVTAPGLALCDLTGG